MEMAHRQNYKKKLASTIYWKSSEFNRIMCLKTTRFHKDTVITHFTMISCLCITYHWRTWPSCIRNKNLRGKFKEKLLKSAIILCLNKQNLCPKTRENNLLAIVFSASNLCKNWVIIAALRIHEALRLVST